MLKDNIAAERIHLCQKKPAQKTSKKPADVSQAASVSTKPTTKTQTLPQAQFSVLAPGHDGNADGTQAKSAADKGNGLSTDILAALKASRQETASQAQRLSKPAARWTTIRKSFNYKIKTG
ncbi:hypothetical protein PKHYL_25940 [Psychrobacter sp. KH172YL61]|uniref:hypothetical protein n=1 Tax=Psychrobacter sp. KH172YL61 TaxID=2517899 RepID=UPI0010B2C3CF|nr:hypothetical protein [Psychrobacter sp. KH172YL61]BBI68403.1 hypothetical protein PKHYL_25940 [Psychrobacter sp. KH172YL61]